MNCAATLHDQSYVETLIKAQGRSHVAHVFCQTIEKHADRSPISLKTCSPFRARVRPDVMNIQKVDCALATSVVNDCISGGDKTGLENQMAGEIVVAQTQTAFSSFSIWWTTHKYGRRTGCLINARSRMETGRISVLTTVRVFHGFIDRYSSGSIA